MRASLLGWCLLYLPHYLKLPPATFHPEFIALLENPLNRFISITGFRGSAKSSFASLALPLWAAMEHPSQYPFIVLFADTAPQASLMIANLRHELETNELLIRDYGDASAGVSKQKEWTKQSLLFANGCRIMAKSRGQRIRGLRHREHRPSLVIVDDPEELEKVQKKEYRDKTERWLKGDLIPAIEEAKARLIIVGNILHTDALMARLKNEPLFVHRDYPLIDSEGKITWRAKYPTDEALKQQEQKVGRTAWLREYLLKVVPPEGQEVKEEWLQYYDTPPTAKLDPETQEWMNPIQFAAVGVDLAISKKETADFTAMVAGVAATDEDGVPRLYVLPNPINERLSFHETIEQMKSLDAAVAVYAPPMFYIEDVAYQRAAIEEAQRNGIPATPMKVGTDKRARLRAAATFVQNGMVLFPRHGCEDLIAQLTGFGIEEHDDLVDAFVHLVMGSRMLGIENQDIVQII